MKMELGQSSQKWVQYELFDTPLLYNGEPSEYKTIVQNDELVAIVGKDYELLPNEEAVKLADEAAGLAGMVPFDEFTGDWFIRMGDHVIKNGAKVHALYAINKPYHIGKDKMHLGVGVHNSIDGSMGFGAGVFTFRNACANMVFAGMRGYEQGFDQRATLDHIYQKHTSGLRPIAENLEKVILGLMEKAGDIIASYEEMARRRVTLELLEKIKKSGIREKVLPDYLKTEKDAPLEVPDISEWVLYNDITEKVWHNPDRGLDAKLWQFKALHKIMPIAGAPRRVA
jgi:hypothetical protein